MNEPRDPDLSALLGAASETFRPDPDLRRRVDLRAAQQRRRARAAMTVAVLLIVATATSSLVYRGRQSADVTTEVGAPGSTVPATAAPPSFVTPTAAATPPHAVDWHTNFVTFQADDYHVDVDGQRFVGDDPALVVRSDPGLPNQYTTLEVTWHEHGIEMRMNIYFKSDGAEWWSDEIRTYGVQPRDGWITYRGDFFRRPLGQAFTGDLNLPADARNSDRAGSLTAHGLRVLAFPPPPACANQTTAFTLEVLYPEIEMTTTPRSGYGAKVRLRGAHCEPVADLSPFGFTWQVDDPSVVEVSSRCDATTPPPMADCQAADVTMLGAGQTVIRVTVRSLDDNSVVAAGEMHVTVMVAR